jgi:hypothetical protein
MTVIRDLDKKVYRILHGVRVDFVLYVLVIRHHTLLLHFTIRDLCLFYLCI